MAEDVAVIANITEQGWILHRTYGTFLIRGCAEAAARVFRPGEFPPPQNTPASQAHGVIPSERSEPRNLSAAPAAGSPERAGVARAGVQGAGSPEPAGVAPSGADYALTCVTARKGIIDLGDRRTLDFPISAREIAADLSREINSDAGENSFLGVFVCAGAAPSAEELDAAHRRLAEFYARVVAVADQEWERTRNFLVITDVQRRAARWLGLEKEWTYEPKPLVDCPACGEKLKPGVAVCRTCGAVLDREKALQFGLAPAMPASPPPAPVLQGVAASAPTEKPQKRPGA